MAEEETVMKRYFHFQGESGDDGSRLPGFAVVAYSVAHALRLIGAASPKTNVEEMEPGDTIHVTEWSGEQAKWRGVFKDDVGTVRELED